MRVAVVLPAYNEEGNLTPLVDALFGAAEASRLPLEIIVVNDGSVDGTAAELAALQRARGGCLRVETHAANRGFAQAIRTGIAAACAGRFDAAVFMDSDLSHRPDDLPGLVAALERGADLAIGSRFVPGGGMEGVPAWRAAISRAGNIVGRLALGVPIRDLTTGYRAVRRRVLETVTLTETGFTIQLESVVKAHAAGFRVVEVPIVLSTRRHGVSHMNYNAALFVRYWQLLLKCRAWLREPPA